ncbi:lipopolysaccharide biosynthesis protein [Ferrimonas futtsuensis]|uniref:lipopolysaccharide biosynthesis protein n=1 Tax=Ferrimonas futtsuensis TaxID=364764 RepID=UPI00042254AF|nr:oligosaccharide flippase family protein [Ferrimonas futtsuensis]
MLGRTFGHYAIAGVSQKAVGLVLIPITAHFLGAQGYGQLALLVALANLGSIIAALGLPEYLQRYAYRRVNCHQGAVLGARWAVILLLISPLLAWALSTSMPGDLRWSWVQWLLVNLALGALLGLRLVLLRVANRSGRYLALIALHSGCHLALTLFALLTGLGPGGMMAAGALATLIALGLEAGGFWGRLVLRPIPSIRPILAYSLPLALSLAATFVLNGYERPWLAQVLSLEQLGAYALMAQLSLLPAYAMEPFMLWWGPKRHVLASQQQWDEIARWVALACVGLMLMIALAALILPPLIVILFDPEFHSAIEILPWLLAATLFRQLSAMMNLGLYHRSTGNLPLCLNLVLVVPALVLIPLVIQAWGAQGLVGLITGLMVAKFLMTLLISQHLMKLPYAYPVLVATLLPLLAGLVGSPLWLGLVVVLSLLILIRRSGTGRVFALAEGTK